MGLDLGDVGDLVFDGVFDGDDLAHPIVDLFQRAVEGGRLPRAGGTRDQDNSVRFGDPFTHRAQVVRQHAQAVQPQGLALLRQQAHHDRLAVHTRQGRDPHIQLLAADADTHAPILG
ncbi:hypothetical protein D9M71_728740 [compost metagenome]